MPQGHKPGDWVRKRAYVYKRDGHECRVCGTDKELTIDHIIPRVKGGDNHISNLWTLCRTHNKEKGEMTVEEWNLERQARGLTQVFPLLLP
jgi:5-methylcytosine-specific restriction endonuclease McrA